MARELGRAAREENDGIQSGACIPDAAQRERARANVRDSTELGARVVHR
jgi:hypothetical protein